MVDPVSYSSIFFNGFDAQHQKDDSSGDAFQSELDEVAVSETATTDPVSFGDYGNPPTTSFSASMSSVLWELELNDTPKTFEDVQDELDAASEALRTEFLEFSEMSLEERIRANILREKNITEEDLAKLEPDERAPQSKKKSNRQFCARSASIMPPTVKMGQLQQHRSLLPRC